MGIFKRENYSFRELFYSILFPFSNVKNYTNFYQDNISFVLLLLPFIHLLTIFIVIYLETRST